MWSIRHPATLVWLKSLPVLFLFCILPCSAVHAQLKPARRVLIFNETGTSYPGINIIDQGIRHGLENTPYHLDFYREYLETALFPDPADQQKFRDFYINKYKNHQPDVIITVGSSPLRFMSEAHRTAFPGVPIVFSLPNLSSPVPELDSDFTGVENAVRPAETLEAALRLQPGTEHVIVVGGTAAYDRSAEEAVRERLRPYEARLDISYLTDLSMPDLLEHLKHLQNHTVVLFTSMTRDAAGSKFISASESAPMVVAAANAPVFGLYDVFLNHGIVGGDLSSLSQQGEIAGRMALRILSGEKPENIPRAKDVTAYMFDWRVLKRWALDERKLPPGSIVLNRQLTVWDLYKWYIVSGLCLLVAQTSLIIGLLWQRATRRKAQAALKESEQRFRLVANTAPVMIWTTGTDKLCNYVNKPWLDFTGRTLEQELGSGWSEGIHSEDIDTCVKTYAEAFDKREQFEMQYRVRRLDGEYRWVFDIGVPRFNADGSFAGHIGSCLDVTERKRAEEALSTIGRRLIEAHEEERAWIGRELHDDINQRLALLAVELDQWNKEDTGTNFSEHVRHAQSRITEIAKDVQALSHRLHSSKLDYLGLAVAAKSFCGELSGQAKVEVQFSHSAVPSTMPKEVSLCLFRVLQEALQNAIKHSGVRLYYVNLRGTADRVELTVSDDGRGFDEQMGFTSQGLGLISMRERLQMVNGVLDIQTQPGAGTTISARVPLHAELQAKAG
jgi:PAS domain S-box-containing protein